MAFCRKCAHQLTAEDIFCPGCGARAVNMPEQLAARKRKRKKGLRLAAIIAVTSVVVAGRAQGTVRAHHHLAALGGLLLRPRLAGMT